MASCEGQSVLFDEAWLHVKGEVWFLVVGGSRRGVLGFFGFGAFGVDLGEEFIGVGWVARKKTP